MFSTALPYVNSISSLYMVIIPGYDQTLDPWLQSFVYKRNDKAVVIGSGSTSVTVSGGGGEGLMAPFTAIQWQELEQQALIYKYMVAGVPVPSDLVLPIRRSLEALSARLFHHPALGYSYSGKKFDPEPGRCRRTDGKKWRCAKNAYQESKYCERHMNRGRNRSRKPVESQSTDSTGSGKGSYQNASSSRSSSQSLLYSITNSGACNNGSNSIPYGTNSKDHLRYAQGVSVNADDQNYISEDSWRLMPSENPLLDPQNDCYLGDTSLQLNMRDAFEPIIDANPISSSDQRQQHCFLGTRIDHEQHSIHEWSKAKETCSD